MASKINLACQIFETKITEKPPVPSRPSSGKFHNRGSLFPSTHQSKLFQPPSNTSSDKLNNEIENTCRELELHSSAVTENSDKNKSKSKKIPSYCRRTQSAKARQRTKPAVPISKTNRPNSAGALHRLKKKSNVNNTVEDDTVSVVESNKQVAVIDIADNIIPDLFDIHKEKLLALPDPRNYKDTSDMPPMCFTRPSSASYDLGHSADHNCKSNTLSKELEKRLKPSIYGLQRQRQVYGSAPDLSCDIFEWFPYKVVKNEAGENTKCTNEEILDSKIKNLPETLKPLCPWLVNNISQEVIGADPANCLVFLPSMDYSSLPEVPEPHTSEDDLPYFKDVTTPRPWNPKKYPHPFNKQPVEEWVCKHSSHTATEEENLRWTTVYKSFKLPRMRTAEVIKKEISDLENLLKGVGTQESSCAMVRYQDDLSTLQDMLQVTMDKIPERLKTPAPESTDRFGLNKVFKDHDSTIKEIQARVEECRLELAELELEAGIESERQYFRKRSNSTL